MCSSTQWRYERFAQEFFVDLDPSAAYRRAGFKAATAAAGYTAAARLFRNVRVQAYLAEEFQRLQGRLTLDQDRHATEVCHVAYSDLRDVCSWGPDGVVLKPSDAIPEHAARAVQSVKSTMKTRMVPSVDGQLVPEVEVRTEVLLHPKVQALSLLHQMFDRGQAVRQHLEGKLRELAGLAAKYVPTDDRAQYLAEARMVLGNAGQSVLSQTPPRHEAQ
jgi:hypothetical protein